MKKLLIIISMLFFNVCFPGKIYLPLDLVGKNSNIDQKNQKTSVRKVHRVEYIRTNNDQIYGIKFDLERKEISRRLHEQSSNNLK